MLTNPFKLDNKTIRNVRALLGFVGKYSREDYVQSALNVMLVVYPHMPEACRIEVCNVFNTIYSNYMEVMP